MPLVETTLVWVLFSDAARVRSGTSARTSGRCVRLLALGLPLTVLAGWGSRPGCCPGSAAGSRCWSARRWPPPTPPWACRS